MPEPEVRIAAPAPKPVHWVARIGHFVGWARPLVLLAGLTVLGGAFGLLAWAIQKDYLLRASGLWNGVTGPARGISAHGANKAMAELAVGVAQWATGAVGLTLLIPRREERPFFRWTAWIWLLVAAVLFAVALFGLAGLTLHHAAVSFDPTCPLDGPCDHAARALPPRDWRIGYLGAWAVAATSVAGIFAACLGVRWVYWALAKVLRRAAPRMPASAP